MDGAEASKHKDPDGTDDPPVVSLADDSEIAADWCQQIEAHAVSRAPIGNNVELCDGSTQTPASIPKQCEADFILKAKGNPSKHEEILSYPAPIKPLRAPKS